MKIIQCEHGHYYDSEKFETCPHCQAINSEADSPIIFDQRSSVTEVEMLDSTDADDQKTVPIHNEVHNNVVPDEAPENEQIVDPQPVQQAVQQPISQVQAVQPVQQAIPQPMQQIQQPLKGTTLEELMKKARAQSNKPQDDNVTVRFSESDKLSNPTVGWLIGMNDDYYGVCFELKVGKNFVGRNYDMDVILDSDMSVSRNRHAIIIYEPKSKMFIAQPGESRELFYLNDDVVLQNEFLKPYDILSIGKTKLLFFPLCGEKFSWEELNK